MRSLALRLTTGAYAFALLAGCSSSEAGNARPADPEVSTGNGGSSRPAPTRTAPASSSSPLDRVKACELLSDSDRVQLELKPGKPRKVVRSDGCEWTSPGAWVLAIGLQTQFSFKDANLRGATPIPVNIGRHEAHRVENAGGGEGGCEIFIVTGDSSFTQVTVANTSGSNTPLACDRVTAVAKIVDPKLP